MNDPSTFCNYPCNDPVEQATAQGLPPTRGTAPPPANETFSLSRRGTLFEVDATNTTTPDYMFPPYAIHVATTGLSDRTAYTDIKHANGLMEYDTRKLVLLTFYQHICSLMYLPIQTTCTAR